MGSIVIKPCNTVALKTFNYYHCHLAHNNTLIWYIFIHLFYSANLTHIGITYINTSNAIATALNPYMDMVSTKPSYL